MHFTQSGQTHDGYRAAQFTQIKHLAVLAFLGWLDSSQSIKCLRANKVAATEQIRRADHRGAEEQVGTPQ